jgi:Uma2 family endonuclease
VAFAGGSADHDRIGFNVRNALERLFPAPCRTFGADLKVRFSETGFFYCDAGVARTDLAPDALFVETPLVVVEVLSRSTRAYDVVEKRAAHRTLAPLQWYVIVHTDIRRIEVDSRSRTSAWATEIVDDGETYLGNGGLSLDAVYARSSLER